jgi:hypothetical protein
LPGAKHTWPAEHSEEAQHGFVHTLPAPTELDRTFEPAHIKDAQSVLKVHAQPTAVHLDASSAGVASVDAAVASDASVGRVEVSGATATSSVVASTGGGDASGPTCTTGTHSWSPGSHAVAPEQPVTVHAVALETQRPIEGAQISFAGQLPAPAPEQSNVGTSLGTSSSHPPARTARSVANASAGARPRGMV